MSALQATFSAVAKVQDPAKFLLVPTAITANNVHPSTISTLPATVEVDTASPQYEALVAKYDEGGLSACTVSITFKEEDGKWVPDSAEVV